VNFAPLLLLHTRPDQCLRLRRRADDGPGFHGLGGLSYSPQTASEFCLHRWLLSGTLQRAKRGV